MRILNNCYYHEKALLMLEKLSYFKFINIFILMGILCGEFKSRYKLNTNNSVYSNYIGKFNNKSIPIRFFHILNVIEDVKCCEGHVVSGLDKYVNYLLYNQISPTNFP